MSLLRTEPPAPVRSMDELFAIAEALEQEAAARYADLAAQMRAAGQVAVAEVFEHLAAVERGHAGQVEGWARAVTGALPDPARIRWQPPETFDEEEARGIASSSLASAYRALSMAVRNEERAFALWTYIAAQAEDRTVREAAERMAGEELRHAALLRRERRRAYHAERDRPGLRLSAAPRLPPAQEAVRAERALATLLATLAAKDDGADAAGQLAAAELRRLAAEAADMAEAAAASAAAAAAVDSDERAAPRHGGTGAGGSGTAAAPPPRHGGAAATPPPPSGAEEAGGGLAAARRLAERTVEAYLDAADTTRDEDAMRRLQELAERAIARVALLRRLAEAGP